MILTLVMIWVTRLSLTALSDPSELLEMAVYLSVFTAFVYGAWWKSKAKPGASAETTPPAPGGVVVASKELIYFRLVLACSLLAITLSAVTWSYCKYEEITSSKKADQWIKEDASARDSCLLNHPNGYGYCTNENYQKLISIYMNESAEAVDHEEQALLTLLGAPLAMWIVFYLVRWSILGRVRPLWLLGKD